MEPWSLGSNAILDASNSYTTGQDQQQQVFAAKPDHEDISDTLSPSLQEVVDKNDSL